MKFIGRNDELAALEREYKRESGFVVIYGRRRVGKTTLIKQFIKDKNALYFLTSQESSKQNMSNLITKIAQFTGQSYLENAHLESWEHVFKMFAENNPEQKKILIIDEFQYLVKADPAFPSIFQYAWDEILKDHNVMVILCGSHISMMTSSVLSHSSPLYGRRTAQIRLRPLRFAEFSMAFENLSFEERVKIYSVTGGVPKYIEFFDNDESLEKNIVENVLDRSGFLSEEPSFLLSNEVKETSSYFSILKAISMGNHRISEIATVLEQKTNELSPYLATLVDLFLVEKRVPITENNPEKSRKGLYYINDNFMEFWFKFVFPYKGELELDNIEFVVEKLKNNFVDHHVSFVYEQVSKELLVDLCKSGKIDFNISRIGSYWNGSTEIDVVAIDEQIKRLLAGECKFYEKPVGIRVYSELLKKCESIPEFKGYKVIYAIFSKSGFEKRLEEIAKENDRLILINGENVVLYDDAQNYIDKLTESTHRNEAIFRTGNRLADAILTDKSESCRDHADIEFDGCITDKIGNSDICIILANALDNAVEACKKCPERGKITVAAQIRQGYWTMTMRNPTVSADSEGIMKTSKEDERNHGFGLLSIEQTVKKYDGTMAVSIKDGMFEMSVVLKIPEQK